MGNFLFIWILIGNLLAGEAKAEPCFALLSVDNQKIVHLSMQATTAAVKVGPEAASDLACMHGLTDRDKDLLNSFDEDIKNLYAKPGPISQPKLRAKVDAIVKSWMLMLSPAGQLALLASAAQTRAKMMV